MSIAKLSVNLDGISELRKQLGYFKKNMQAIGAYSVDIVGGHRKKIRTKKKQFKGREKPTPDGNAVIHALKKLGYDYMNNTQSIIEEASRKLTSMLIQYVTPHKMNKDNWAEIRELLRTHGRLFLSELQKHWMASGAGWNTEMKYREKKQYIQAGQNLNVVKNLSGILTGRTVQSLKIQLKNQRFIKSKRQG